MTDRPAHPSRPLPRSRRGLLVSSLAIAAALLAGCATPDRLPPGTTRAEVLATLGQPVGRQALVDGGERLEYQIGPHQQTAWMVDLDRSGRLVSATQARTAENFARLKPGIDTPSTARREFGTPWHVERYALSGLTAYLYPYREAGSLNLMMALLFDDAGVLRRVESGPDPRFIGGRDRND